MNKDKKLKDIETEEVSGREESNRPSMLREISYCRYCNDRTEVDSFKINHGCLSILGVGNHYMRYKTDIKTCKVCGQETEWWGNKMVVDGKFVDPPQ